jgi:RimJ/RimL family protein N-acetyltransferase
MIYGERIRLRADERADIPFFVQWLNDPEVIEHLSFFLPLSQAVEEGWFDAMLKLPPEQQSLAIEVKSGESWKLVGNCGWMNFDWRARSAEVGLFLGDKSCWDQGYGTEVMRLLLQQGFETLNLNRVFLRVDETNARAIHVYERVGFQHEGRLRQAVYRNGLYQDTLIMSVLRVEWVKTDSR